MRIPCGAGFLISGSAAFVCLVVSWHFVIVWHTIASFVTISSTVIVITARNWITRLVLMRIIEIYCVR